MIYFSLKGEKKRIDKKDIEENFKRAILSEKSYFDQLWLDLMENKYFIPVLKSIVIQNKSPYKIRELTNHNLYRSLVGLERKGLIKKIYRGRYEVKDPFSQGVFETAGRR